MPQVPKYGAQKVAPTLQTGFVPRSAQQIALEGPLAGVQAAQQLANVGVAISQKMREAEHVSNYADVTHKAQSLINNKMVEYEANPTGFNDHLTDFENTRSELVNLTSTITDPLSRQQIDNQINSMYQDAELNVDQLSSNQRIDNGKIKINSSLDTFKRSGDTSAYQTLLTQGYSSGYYTAEEYSNLMISGTRKSEINRASNLIIATPDIALDIVNDETFDFDPDTKLDLIRLGNNLQAKQEQASAQMSSMRQNEAQQLLTDRILAGDTAGASELLSTYSRTLTPEQRISYNNMINNSDSAMDWSYYNDIVYRTMSGANTVNEIRGTNRVPNNKKEHLLNLYQQNAGGDKKTSTSKAYQFQYNRLKAAYITTGPLSDFVNPEEQMALANDAADLWDDINEGKDPETTADSYITRNFRLSKTPPKTIYGQAGSYEKIEEIKQKAVADFQAGIISSRDFQLIGETLIIATQRLDNAPVREPQKGR